MESILPDIFSQFIHKSRYARWDDEKQRREHWDETVKRYFDFFEKHLKENNNFDFKPYRKDLEESFLKLLAVGSMRVLMTAGKALERDHIAAYNCGYLHANRLRSFDELMYILLNGTGNGFSVERQFIPRLPTVPDDLSPTDTTIVVGDSKLGWAKSYRELISLLYAGQIPKWDISKVRPAGSRLKTFGGRASGPAPLESLFRFTIDIFKGALGRKLNSLEIHDIFCKIGNVVVVGGVRRSALISLSNLTDERMRNAKTGNWSEQNPQRRLANNSVCYTEKPDIGIFMKEWLSLYDSKSGERGIFNREAVKNQVKRLNEFDGKEVERRKSEFTFGTNPCCEIILRDREFCNLSEGIIRCIDTLEEIEEKVRIAAIFGTIQATLTNFKWITAEWKKNCEEEALLGLSLTGIMDHDLFNGHKDFKGLPERLEKLKRIAFETNKKWAKMLGINSAAAITCVKPSGCQGFVNKIRTVEGDRSLLEIFEGNGYNIDNILSIDSGTWLSLNKELYVFDKNNEKQEVTKLFFNGLQEVYEINFDDEIYHFTGNHRLMLSTGDWKRVDELQEEDDILNF